MTSAVDARAFSEGLRKVSKVLERSCIPCLNAVFVEVKDGRCTLTGTNLGAWVTLELPAAGDELSCLLGRPKDVERACRHFDGPLELELSEAGQGDKAQLRMKMRCGSRAAEFEALPAEDRLVRPELEGMYELTMPTKPLLERVERVRYATMKPGQSRRESSSCVQFNGNQVYALDGYRLACDSDPSVVFPAPFLISTDAAGLLKLLDGEQTTLRIGARYVCFQDGIISVMVRRAESRAYDLESAIPREFRDELLVSPEEFLQELDFLQKSAPETKKPYVRFGGGDLLMSVGGSEFRTAIRTEGESTVTFGFDLRYMKDALRQFRSEERVKLKIVSPSAPVILEAEGRGDFALICTIRLKDELLAA